MEGQPVRYTEEKAREEAEKIKMKSPLIEDFDEYEEIDGESKLISKNVPFLDYEAGYREVERDNKLREKYSDNKCFLRTLDF